MTIRYRLLFSHLLVSLTSSLLITAMFFMHFSTVLTKDIKRNLEIEASSIMQEVDWHLFERIQNIMAWQKLAVMQDIRVHDIDKRLAYFLYEMNKGYHGIYDFLLVLDNQKKLIASSDLKFSYPIPDLHQNTWQAIDVDKQALYIQSGTVANNFFCLGIPIQDQFQVGILGYFYTAINWDGIYRILESPLPFLENSDHAYTLVVDQNNKIIAASQQLRKAGLLYTQLPKSLRLKESVTDAQNHSLPFLGHLLLKEQITKVQTINTPFLGANTWLVAQAKSTGHRSYQGLGWKVLVMHPKDNALQPVYDIWKILLFFISFTTILTTILSFWNAQRIAKPIIQLAKFTRDYMLNPKQTPPSIQATGEIRELNEQFNKMICYLEQSQQDKVRMAKFAVIAEMAATMAHEIRTPLGILRSSAQMLSREKNLSPIAEEMLGFINSETTRLNDLVTTLLNSSQTRELHFVKHDLAMAIEHILELLRATATKKHIQINFQKPNSPCILAYDWDQILQVFLNLVMNAIQHTPKSGSIRITLSDEINHLLVLVTDTGSGISDEYKARIFEPFFTKRQDGIGLGLMVVQQIIHAHQGEIKVSDSASGGACFAIQLPKDKEK